MISLVCNKWGMLPVLIILSVTFAHADVYKCVVNGKTVYSDTRCSFKSDSIKVDPKRNVIQIDVPPSEDGDQLDNYEVQGENKNYDTKSQQLNQGRLRTPKAVPYASTQSGNCVSIGNSVNCSNGVTYQRFGNATVGSDGSTAQQIGNTTIRSNGVNSQRIGNTTIHSNGTTSQRIGNTIINSNGTTCQIIGSQTICN